MLLLLLAVADRGNLLHAPDMYMDKIAVGPEAVGVIDIDAPVIDNLKAVAKAKNKDIEDVVVTILNRERHQDIIKQIREAGARIKLIEAGDVAGAINTAFDHTGVDIIIWFWRCTRRSFRSGCFKMSWRRNTRKTSSTK